MPDDVLLGKAEIIERCSSRIREEYGQTPSNLFEDLTRQDSILLNLQRSCEAAIGGAMHVVRRERLGVPQESREAFERLIDAGMLDRGLGEPMISMVGFRNVAVHNYRALDLEIVQSIVEDGLEDFAQFASWMIDRATSS